MSEINRNKNIRTAGEVRFIKDDSNSPMNAGNWAWGGFPPTNREINPNFKFDPDCSAKLVAVLKSTLFALGHTLHAYDIFAKLKSRSISPDGSLGGKGYIQEVKHMRKQFMNTVEALSALSDTLNDEVKAPHWALASRDPQEVDSINDIKEDPEKYAERQMKEDAKSIEESSKIRTASIRKRASVTIVADKYIRSMK